MQRYKLRSYRDRKEMMGTFTESSQQDLDTGKTILEQGIIDQAIALNSEYQTVYNSWKVAYSLRRNAVAKHEERVSELNSANSDFYATLERRSRRLKEPPGVIDFYKAPVDRGRPRGTTQKRVLQLAQDILEGEPQAVAHNFPAMTNPSAEEIQKFLDKATETALTLTQADRNYQEAQQEIQAITVRVDIIAGDLYRAFQTATHELTGSARRRLMRRYGFTFVQEGKDLEVPVEEEENKPPVAEESPNPESGQSEPDPVVATVGEGQSAVGENHETR